MRIKLIQKPSAPCIDGIRLDLFEVGCQYEVGNLLGALMLSEQWAEPVASDEPALIVPLRELVPDRGASDPRNLIREAFPPYFEGPSAMALDRRRRSRHRSS